MGIPEEDLGPRWLRDYGSLYDIGDQNNPGAGGVAGADGGTGVRVDLPALKDFAAALQKNVEDDYKPHAQKVFDDMAVPAEGQLSFQELWWALEQHDQVKIAATDNVANHGNGTKIFAVAADEISQRYQSSDAYAAAQLSDVHNHLGTSPGQPAATDPATGPGTDPGPATGPAEGA
jgi:hypothetical protein